MTLDIVGTRWRHRRNTDPTLDVIVLAVVESHGVEFVVHGYIEIDGCELACARLVDFRPNWQLVEP